MRAGSGSNARSLDWARFSEGVCGAKLHVVYDPDADRPIYAAITPARVNDITAAQAMPIEPGATYVFDLGYYDYAWWAKLDAAQCRIITRLKSNTPLDGRGIGRARGQRDPRRPDRPSAGTPGQRAQQPLSGPGARGSRQARYRQGVAHPVSTPRPRRSPISTSGAGRSSCSSDGSSRPSKSAAFSASARMPCASKSRSR